MEIPNLNNIPIYLEASTKEELMGLMWANNAINSRAYNYMNPFKDGKKWVVWFYADINNWKKPNVKDARAKDVDIK
jgi:hypothetical protein